jgi:1-deoxy-D-xylulose-5-phosphate reductoisomerase
MKMIENPLNKKRLSIWGSTGSIGSQTLEVVRQYPGEFQIVVLAAHTRAEKLWEQAREFCPERVILTGDVESVWISRFQELGLNLETGSDALIEAASRGEEDRVVNGLVGAAGLHCTVKAIERGTAIALANKEVLVMAGELVNRLLKKYKAEMIPVDSEHSAIYQCLQGEPAMAVRRIILTASGGPFRNHSLSSLANVTVEEALAHPNWNMGPKITIDSATMVNKALEIIEAHWLFGMQPSQIEVVIHPQSILHSMVEFVDGSLKAQLSIPDMRVPIAYALSSPGRRKLPFGSLDLSEIRHLELYPPDFERFPALKLAYEVIEAGGTAPVVLNGADEVAVQAFLERRIRFNQIAECIHRVLDRHTVCSNPEFEDIIKADRWARETVSNFIRSIE